MVVDQHAALRHGDEEAELDKDQQDRDEDPADGERGAALLMRENAPGKTERHGFDGSLCCRKHSREIRSCPLRASFRPGKTALYRSRPDGYAKEVMFVEYRR